MKGLVDRLLPVGPRSVLFGAHQFAIHPLFVAWAWKRLYGWPLDPRLWCAFCLHDLGYLFMWCRDMDGAEGERHPEWAAFMMGRLFGREWGDLVLYHSRFYAKRAGKPVSRLGIADKLAVALTPVWLYLPLARLTGEVKGYMRTAQQRCEAGEPKYASMKLTTSSEARWYADVQEYMIRWVGEHRDGREDTWTPDMGDRRAVSESGVWQ